MVARGGAQRIPRPPGTRPGRPAPWARPRPAARRFTLADVRAALADPPEPAGVLDRRARRARGRGARRDVRGRRRGRGPAHQAARDDAVAPGRDRVPRRQARARATPTSPPRRCGRRRRRSASSRTRSRSWPSSTRIGTVASAFTITPFVGLLAAVPELRPDPREVVDAFAVPISELLDPDAYREETWDLFGAPRPMAFFELPGETVWGATARILTRLLDRSLTGHRRQDARMGREPATRLNRSGGVGTTGAIWWKSRSGSGSRAGGRTASTTSPSCRVGGPAIPRTSTSPGTSTRSSSSSRSIAVGDGRRRLAEDRDRGRPARRARAA